MTIATAFRRWLTCGSTILLMLAASNNLLLTEAAAEPRCDALQGQLAQARREASEAEDDDNHFYQRWEAATFARDLELGRINTGLQTLLNEQGKMEAAIAIIEKNSAVSDQERGDWYMNYVLALAELARKRKALLQERSEIEQAFAETESTLEILSAGALSRKEAAHQRVSQIESAIRDCPPAPDSASSGPRKPPPAPRSGSVPWFPNCAEARAAMQSLGQRLNMPGDRETMAAVRELAEALCAGETADVFLPMPEQDSTPAVPAVSSTDNCESATAAVDRMIQFRYAPDRVGSAAAMAQSICDREAAQPPQAVVGPPNVGVPGGVPPRRGQPPRVGGPSAAVPPSAQPPAAWPLPPPLPGPPGGTRTTTVHPPKQTTTRTKGYPPPGQQKTVRRPQPTPVVRQPVQPNRRTTTTTTTTRVVQPRINTVQPRQPAPPARTTRCRYKGSIPYCDTR